MSPATMKTTLLFLLGATAIFIAGCESEMPPEPGKPVISYAPGTRDQTFEHPAGVAPQRETTVR